MAILFTSPKKKKRVLFTTVAIVLVLFLAIVSAVVFLPEFLNTKQPAPAQVSQSTQDSIINLHALDLDKVKNLESFPPLETPFTYVVQDQDGREITGSISAVNEDDARKLLEGSGLKVSSIQEANVGNSNPFDPY